MRKKWKVESGKWKVENLYHSSLITRHSSLITLYLLIFLASISFTALAQDTTDLESKVFEIARDLRCPVCTAESVGDSSSSVAIEMRNLIQDQLEQGKNKEEILAFFQERYGDWIMLNPPKRGVHLLVWILPLIAALIGLTLLSILFRRWTQKSKVIIDVSTEDLARVREEMKWQD